MPKMMPWKNDDRWSSLLPELLLRILTRMSCAADHVRFGLVCTRWRSLLTVSRHLLPPTDPLLMLPYTEDDPSPYQVYDIPVSWVHRVLLPDSQIEPTLPPDQRKMMKLYRCHRRPKKIVFGSSMGWLFLDDCGVFSLWNPVTGAEIPLPLLFTAPTILHRNMEKAALSSNPNSEDCVIMVISRGTGTLSFCRVGDEKWTVLEAGGSFFLDVVFYQGQFYAVTCQGEVATCDVSPNPKLTFVGMHDYDPRGDIDRRGGNGRSILSKDYLVESSGELLKVTRIVECIIAGNRDVTFKFVVHKLDGRGRAGTWNKMKSIGDQALFLGGSSSVSLAASEVHDGGCRRNCIYFLDDGGCSDMGVFDLEDGSVSTFGINTYYKCSSSTYYCSTFLYTPQFWIRLALW